ncbi:MULTISPECIES: ArnT family glycosyltransferase [unclassified Pedobacter]|uniref:ArnT family glycosyltransferase n=1 Tax=unclassified Pedobacter TaxID=2628915 RepID=UPI00141EF90C|nr:MULTISPECIES: glycosyltransferase family 39 protein [unclassified Pedobacter]NII85128.1 4-amino-4-deoxy-L-arabinose transferase-like glycosyltransferase [Pedobacter sp. SG908]NMN37964.1 4-amino-4-deoxy-L-arabinose transferase-like glycosyltransferase [Pedobacter sp. SG918]
MDLKDTALYKILIVLIALVSVLALFGGVMEPDSALYASIAKNMVLRNDWVNIYVRGADWLDKPHLTFWLAAASFKIFGITAFAYKLPSFLFGLLGAWYVYKLARDIYGEKTGLISTLIFLSSLHILISTFDVRAEVYITTFTLAAIYHYYKAHYHAFWHIVAGSFFAACAIMIKGIFVLIPVFGGFIIYWLLTRQFKQLLKLKWWLAIVLIFIFIIPELYTLYVQFDLHPEKVVFGKTGVSGLKFFFWDSQFGRFFNNGPIKGKGDISFFLHTTLWAFLPWSILFYTAVVNLFKKRNRIDLPAESIMIWTSAAITFLLFSLSKFQLPHYILIILPQFAIITAWYVQKLNGKSLSIFSSIQTTLSVLIVILLSILAILFKFQDYHLAIAIIIIVLVTSFILFKGLKTETLIGRSLLTSVGLMIFLSSFFYPALLKYEAGMQAGLWLKENYPGTKPMVLIYSDAYSFDFYAKDEPKYFWSYEELEKVNPKGLILFVDKRDIDNVRFKYPAKILQDFRYFHTTKLTPKFLNSNTREEVLEHFFLIKIL